MSSDTKERKSSGFSCRRIRLQQDSLILAVGFVRRNFLRLSQEHKKRMYRKDSGSRASRSTPFFRKGVSEKQPNRKSPVLRPAKTGDFFVFEKSVFDCCGTSLPYMRRIQNKRLIAQIRFHQCLEQLIPVNVTAVSYTHLTLPTICSV